jgi:DNA-binding MarR family transcriptional regulator
MHRLAPSRLYGSARCVTDHILGDTKYLNYDATMAAKPDRAQTSEVVDSLVQLSFTVHDVLTRVAAEHDLSVTQLRLLGILRDRTPPMTALAQHLRIDPSSVTGLVSRAEQRGLVSRTAAPHDGRVTIVSATAQGLQLGRRLAAGITDEIDALVDDVSATDRSCLVRVASSVLGVDVGLSTADSTSP